MSLRPPRTSAPPTPPHAARSRLLGASVGLFFLAYPLTDVVTTLRGASEALAVGFLMVFVAAYYAVFVVGMGHDPRARRLAMLGVGVMAAMAVALPFAYGDAWVGLSFYVAIALSVVLPRRQAIVGIGWVVVFIFVQVLLLGAAVPDAFLNAVAACGVGGLMLGFIHNRRLVRDLRLAQDEVARLAVAEERLRIARDLHDLLGHTLSLVALKSELARRLSDTDPKAAAREIADVEGVARKALTEVREAVTGYRRQGLAAELDGARSTLAAAGVESVVRSAGEPLPPAVDDLFAWAVREAVTNVVRHAKAQRCEIVVERDRRSARLRVADDGAGAAARVPGRALQGSGLAGLAERAAAAGGSLRFGRRTVSGFELELRVPLQAESETDAGDGSTEETFDYGEGKAVATDRGEPAEASALRRAASAGVSPAPAEGSGRAPDSEPTAEPERLPRE